MNYIELKPIGDILGYNFFIPNYQRGYRWTERQVEDLLEDIYEFMSKKADAFYCIQPLVVIETIPEKNLGSFIERLPKDKSYSILEDTRKVIEENIRWEVIDGQQRLTTIKILLAWLYSNCDRIYSQDEHTYISYSIEYSTREKSKYFLDNILDKRTGDEETQNNIDFYHMVAVKDKIKDWFNETEVDKSEFLGTLLYHVKFIWYEAIDEDPIKVFTRLNIGKVSLTSSELIKAMLLNRSNFENEEDYTKIRLRQVEIATQWDCIEYTLQNDEFWLFIHGKESEQATRIDFIFDIIMNLDLLKLGISNIAKKDRINSYYYFDNYFKKEKKRKICNEAILKECWNKVMDIFNAFTEWNTDIELYHYIGYLVEMNYRVETLYEQWCGDKSKEHFKSIIITLINDRIKDCCDLNYQYSLKNKRDCLPILLLHNLQTIINQNQKVLENQKYALPIFYKFPFHLYKKENWDVEHIDSNTTNELIKPDQKKEWLISVKEELNTEIELGKEIDNTIKLDDDNKLEEIFVDLKEKIYRKVPDIKGDLVVNEKMDEKNKIWNYTLLDASTNRGYGNSILPTKRRKILCKTKGICLEYDHKESKLIEKENKEGFIAFVPIVTQNVFQKAYTLIGVKHLAWYREDAKNYVEDIYKTLSPTFNVKKINENK
jgi:hypothetical protein